MSTVRNKKARATDIPALHGAAKPKLTRESYDENWNMKQADATRTDACPHCGSPRISPLCAYFTCKADTTQRDEDNRTHLCREREARQKAEAERDEARKELIHNLQTTGGMPWREWSAQCAIETRRADENLERAEKSEAEVERMRKIVEAL